MKRRDADNTRHSSPPIQGWAGWLMGRLRASGRSQPRLRLVERIALTSRQSLALVEAEGRRFLVATSADGAPAFYPLEGSPSRSGFRRPSRCGETTSPAATRVSW